MCDVVQSQNIVPKILMVQQISSTLKCQKPMILIEFVKNIFTIRFPIPKSAIICEKVILTFFHPFDHCALVNLPLHTVLNEQMKRNPFHKLSTPDTSVKYKRKQQHTNS